MQQCEHDWRRDLNCHVVQLTSPPRYGVICADCGEKQFQSNPRPSTNPKDWPKVDAPYA